jgi:shikimate kinase
MANDGGALVVLIGAPGAGKTKTGRRLARVLDVPFIDTDKSIVAHHGAIADIFAEHGEPYFRALERAEVERALTEPAVVTLGGGAVLDRHTQKDLAEHPVVQLTISREAAEARIAGGKRPLVTGIDSWAALVATRQPLYDSLADLTIDTSHRPLTEVAAQIAHWLENR